MAKRNRAILANQYTELAGDMNAGPKHTTGEQPRSALLELIRRLLAARALRAIGQGLLTTDFALYLHDLGWTPTGIGALLTSVLVVSVTLTAVIGPISDRLGRRRFVLGYDLLVASGALILGFTHNKALMGRR